ncbi:Fur family transcriptional regulator [Pararhizobium mangrovi]|uniref:Transcriptional repressor n=1 Tax=Pararhizobium mangrovi TaxID=2590452 RepID=A0A506UHM3_9HYPH|nr:Fur family transcriptional regulator [Pararhizobium mangrovi]TPW32813.1 transcriptional repressor [Pararhizobium mangrovi]
MAPHSHAHTGAERGDLTRNQALVLDTLSASEGPLSAYAILDSLRGEGLKAPLQIYRALDKLIEAGLAHRLESVNAFVACAHPHEHGSRLIAFAICKTCGKVSEFSDAGVEERLEGWAREQAFAPERTIVEIRGTCAACAP